MQATDPVTLVTETDGSRHFVDEYGDRWFIFADDMRGHYAVDREDGQRAGMVSTMGGSPTLYQSRDGEFFGVNCTEEFMVEDDAWTTNS